MATIITRASKGSTPLTTVELDQNFTNLNTDLATKLSTNNPVLTAATVIPSSTALVVAVNNLPALDPTLQLDFTNSNRLDPRITFTRSSTATRTNARGLLESVAVNVPRFDYNATTRERKGLLIEEQRTNQIRNNTMQGAVAGTPGTFPTNWGVSLAGGLAREVVGTGSVEGVTYIDVRVFGTTTNTNLALNLRFDVANQITAATGQTWTESVWAQVVGGSTSGVAYAYLTVVESSSAGVDLAYLSGSTFLPTINTFIRRTHSVTTSNAATAFVTPTLWMGHVGVGAVIDVTLRIGLPQLELGAFATTVIPTTTAAVTRAADVATMTGINFSSWYNPVEGTFEVDFDTSWAGVAGLAAISPGVLEVRDFGIGAYNGYSVILSNNSTNSIRWSSRSGSNLQQLSTAYSPYIQKDTLYRFSFAYANNLLAYAGQGTSAIVGTDSNYGLTYVNRLQLGSQWAGGTTSLLNGHIARVAYYPKRLSNTELQALTV